MSDEDMTISATLPGFLTYLKVELRQSTATIDKYRGNILSFVRAVGDLHLEQVDLHDCMSVKSQMMSRGVRDSGVASMIYAVKSLLTYARDVLHLRVMNIDEIRAPRPPRREVVYLSRTELSQFVDSIPTLSPWTGKPRLSGYCLRAIVEILACSALRISEALSLDRDSIDFEKREARITGKGNKERTVFFTPHALECLRRYLQLRKDANAPLFATGTGERLRRGSVEAMFRRMQQRTGLEKRVTPHILRHTAATNLLQNGCPIGYIKEMLGHRWLETTCRFYLGVLNKEDTKKAFDSYMV